MDVQRIVTGPVGTNCWIIKENTTSIIVDPAADDDRIFSAIENSAPTHILLTHTHYDHIGGVEALLNRYPAVELCVHHLETSHLSDPEKNLSIFMGHSCNISHTPDRTLSDGDTLSWNGHKINVLHTPGHTPGGVCYHIGHHLFSGDTLFRGSIGRADLPGGDQHTLMKSIREKLLTLPDNTEVFPGHMDPTTIGNEKKYNPYLI